MGKSKSPDSISAPNREAPPTKLMFSAVSFKSREVERTAMVKKGEEELREVG